MKTLLDKSWFAKILLRISKIFTSLYSSVQWISTPPPSPQIIVTKEKKITYSVSSKYVIDRSVNYEKGETQLQFSVYS